MGAISQMRMVKCNIITLSFRKLKTNSTKYTIKMKMTKIQLNIKRQSSLTLRTWRRANRKQFKSKCTINFFKICQSLMQTSITLSKVSFYRYAIWPCQMKLRGSKMITEIKILEFPLDIRMGIEIQSLRLIHKSHF